jgi:hypothetical protein
MDKEDMDNNNHHMDNKVDMVNTHLMVMVILDLMVDKDMVQQDIHHNNLDMVLVLDIHHNNQDMELEQVIHQDNLDILNNQDMPNNLDMLNNPDMPNNQEDINLYQIQPMNMDYNKNHQMIIAKFVKDQLEDNLHMYVINVL